MRILAIDHGTKRMGLAVSDELGVIAHPLEWVSAQPHDALLQRLRQVVQEKQITLILVGMPRNMDGSLGPAAAKAQDFATEVGESLKIPVKTWDERLTSAQANRVLIEANISRKSRREKVDQMAAAILLQSYLDSQATV